MDKLHVGQIVELLVDIHDSDVIIFEKGTIGEIVEIDDEIDYVLLKIDNMYSWLYCKNVKPKLFKIFMGGTCQGFNWREILEDKFKDYDNIELFNPVVDNWTHERIQIENEYKEISDLNIFVITPYMEGVYSIAEVVDLSNKNPNKTIFAYIDHFVEGKEIRDFTKKMKHSLEVTGKLLERNGCKVFNDLDKLIEFIREYIE